MNIPFGLEMYAWGLAVGLMVGFFMGIRFAHWLMFRKER